MQNIKYDSVCHTWRLSWGVGVVGFLSTNRHTRLGTSYVLLVTIFPPTTYMVCQNCPAFKPVQQLLGSSMTHSHYLKVELTESLAISAHTQLYLRQQQQKYRCLLSQQQCDSIHCTTAVHMQFAYPCNEVWSWWGQPSSSTSCAAFLVNTWKSLGQRVRQSHTRTCMTLKWVHIYLIKAPALYFLPNHATKSQVVLVPDYPLTAAKNTLPDHA